jgi:hypothetical protein
MRQGLRGTLVSDTLSQPFSALNSMKKHLVVALAFLPASVRLNVYFSGLVRRA